VARPVPGAMEKNPPRQRWETSTGVRKAAEKYR